MNHKRATHFRRIFSMVIVLCLALTMLSGAALAAPAEQTASEKPAYRNVMYYGDWSIWGGQKNYYPKDIPADQLTHLNFAFLDFDASGNLVFTDKDAATGAPVGMGVTWGAPNAGILNAMQELRAQNPNLKIGVSIGGWSKSGDFSVVAASASTRAAFVENVMKFIRYTNMDFVDLDWEYPGEYRDPDLVDNTNDEGTTHASAADKENYILLLKDFRAALDKQGAELGKTYELSVALPAPKTKLDNGINIPELFKVVDFANMMTYDMRGAWDEYSGHQTPLYTNPDDPYAEYGYSVDDCVKYLLSQGAPADKIVIGCAFYTRGWQKVDGGVDGTGLFGKAEKINKDADQTETYGATNEAPMKVGEGGRAGGVWSYNALDQLKGTFGGLQEYWDDVAKAPYLYSKTTGAFFTYDNARSIREKAAYVKANGLGGCISWMASQDKATSGSKRDELTKVLKESLFGTAALPAQEIVAMPIDVSFTIEPYQEEWTRSAGFAVTIKNNETKNESNEVLSLVELAGESIKNPKLYITLKDGSTLSQGGYGCGTITNENGVAIVDMATVYDNQTIAQNTTVTFQLRSSKAEVSLDDIESIVLVQRILPTGAEISRQVVFGGETQQNAAPVIFGVKDQSVRVGAAFDPMNGVTATDKEDGDLTAKITVSGSVDTSKAGSYTLTYSVKDSEGKEAAAKAVITVEENAAPVLKGVKDQNIALGAAFDPMAGITATDKEDGDLTAKITVSGSVDASKAGSYTLTYSVKDSEGKEATAKAVITVTEKAPNTAPVITGVKDQTITEGDSFDPMAGVTATDKEDGDLTAKITVSGSVDTSKAGTYELTYTVADAEGATATAKAVITVEAGAVTGDTYDAGKVYTGGATVIYKGQTYKCKWWTQGEAPDTSSAWEPVVAPNPDGTEGYYPGKVFTGGQRVLYEGVTYEAQWWTNSVPGSDSSWKTVG